MRKNSFHLFLLHLWSVYGGQEWANNLFRSSSCHSCHAKNKTSECWIFDNSLKDDLDIDNNQVKHHRLVLSNLVVWRKVLFGYLDVWSCIICLNYLDVLFWCIIGETVWLVVGALVPLDSWAMVLTDKAHRLSIRIVIWILPSDSICQLKKYQQILRRQCYLVGTNRPQGHLGQVKQIFLVWALHLPTPPKN